MFPEFESFFSNIYGLSALSILKEYPSPQKLAKAHANKVSALIHGKCKCSALELIDAAKNTAGIKSDYDSFELIDAIEELEHIQKRVEKYDVQIENYVKQHFPNLLTIPGVGYITAGLIVGEIGDINRFHSADSLVSFAGIDCTVYESGNYKAKHTIPSKKGSKYLRYALFQVARIVWQWDPVFKDYYLKKQSEGKHFYVILGHIQKKLLRVIFSLMKSGLNYKAISA
jgi:transposase